MICPICSGTKLVTLSHVRTSTGGRSNVPMRCYQCRGAGEITEEQAEWIQRGEAMRLKRVGAYRSLRDEAKRLGITAKELSDMENGRIEPKESS